MGTGMGTGMGRSSSQQGGQGLGVGKSTVRGSSPGATFVREQIEHTNRQTLAAAGAGAGDGRRGKTPAAPSAAVRKGMVGKSVLATASAAADMSISTTATTATTAVRGSRVQSSYESAGHHSQSTHHSQSAKNNSQSATAASFTFHTLPSGRETKRPPMHQQPSSEAATKGSQARQGRQEDKVGGRRSVGKKGTGVAGTTVTAASSKSSANTKSGDWFFDDAEMSFSDLMK